MVRREDEGNRPHRVRANPTSRCDDPAGESPVSVSGDAPSSRLPARGEIPVSEAQRQEPESGESRSLGGKYAGRNMK
jgi:hypothetical protein